MKLQTFIDRPILSCVVSVIIFLAGIIALLNLPVEQYPNIAPPTVKVSAQYSGASADAVEKSVIVPLEEAINGVENMTYMTSMASNTGNAEITIFFKQGTDPDMAAVNVQNKVQTATSLLPAEVTKVGVKTTKSQTSTLKIFGLCSPKGTYDKNFLTNYLSINIKPQIQRITGVGEVSVMGGDYAMRIWLKPDIMAEYGLQPSDVENALASQNIEASTGSIGEDSNNVYQYAIKYRGRLEKNAEFENIVIKAYDDGRVLRLRDIATVELGAQRYNYTGGVNGAPGVSCMVYQIAGTNANEIITNIDNYLNQLKQTLPDDIEIVDLVNTKDFLFASINEVVKTLLEAIVLVVLVVFIFLGNLRSTFIPAVSVVVSLVGTFAAIYVAGFSINLLTLFALVLAIGTIVDDAIIVVEAVQAEAPSNLPPRGRLLSAEGNLISPPWGELEGASSLVGAAISNISAAVITSTLVFMAVFVPVSFMGGTAGVFYTQFGVTMAVAVGISAVNALTLSPALCALLLKSGGQKKTSFHTAFEAAFNALLGKYKTAVKLFVRRKGIAWGSLAVATAALCYFMATSKTSLVPSEDTGALYINLNAPAGSSLNQTEMIMAKIEKELKQIPEIENYNVSVGKSIGTANGASYGMFVLKLRHWDERKGKSHSVEAVTKEIYRRTAHIKDAKLIVFAPPMVSGYGSGDGFELYVQDRAGKGTDELARVTNNFIASLNKRKEIQRAFTSFDNTFPQYTLDVDEVACQRAGITTSTVLKVLSGYVGSSYASNFNRFSKLYRVIIQAPSDYRRSLQSLDNIYVKTQGGMAPISQFVTLRKTYGAETLTRFNLFSSVKVQGVQAEGYSSADAIQAIAEVAAETLPTGYGYEYAGMSREEAVNTNSSLFTFIFSLLFIYLILCALYESLLVPFSVLLSVPFGLLGSMLLARICGIDSNIYLQTGLIMLIGLLSKTAILITDRASTLRHSGMSLTRAALSAATVRFRPILMTVLCMVVGMLPLAFASGVGANGNRSLGIGVIGGLAFGSLALLFVTPTFFIVFQWIEERVRRK